MTICEFAGLKSTSVVGDLDSRYIELVHALLSALGLTGLPVSIVRGLVELLKFGEGSGSG